VTVYEALGAVGMGLLLAWARAVAALLIIPILGGRPLPPVVALILSAAIAPVALPSPPWLAEPPAAELVLLAAREVAIGAVLGASARIAFSIFESAGGLVGAAAGGRGLIGEGAGDAGPLGMLFALVGVGAFLLSGGHHAVVSAIAGSFRLCPVGTAIDAGTAIDGALALFSSAFAGAVMAAAPAFAAAIAVEAAAGIASRVAPLAGLELSAPAIRAVCVQVAAVAALVAAVRLGVDLLDAAMAGALLAP
jgi:flagellar biosynthesis protein FliR